MKMTECLFPMLETPETESTAVTNEEMGDIHFADLDYALQGIINGAIANLYHFGWKSPVREWLRHSLVFSGSRKKVINDGEFAKTVELLSKLGWPLCQEPWFPDMNELRLIANTVKHNRGKSAQDLFAVRRTLFFPFNKIERDETIAAYEPNGVDLVPTIEDCERYIAALEAFWTALPEADF